MNISKIGVVWGETPLAYLPQFYPYLADKNSRWLILIKETRHFKNVRQIQCTSDNTRIFASSNKRPTGLGGHLSVLLSSTDCYSRFHYLMFANINL